MSAEAPTPVVRLAGLQRGFEEGGRVRTVLDGTDLEISSGEWVALVGASGSGKTTLLSIIGGLDADFDGEAEIFGRGLKGLEDDARTELRHELVGFVFQSFHLLEHLSVLENVEVPLWLGASDGLAEARRALERVGLGGREQARVRSLSGGERQRVAIARALATKPRLLLADEPTGNLDDETGATILDLFESLRRDAGDGEAPPALLVATHDPRVARRADRVLTLRDGKLTEVES